MAGNRKLGKATTVGLGSGKSTPGKITGSKGGQSANTRPSGKPSLSVPGSAKSPKGNSPKSIGPAPIRRMKSGGKAGPNGY